MPTKAGGWWVWLRTVPGVVVAIVAVLGAISVMPSPKVAAHHDAALRAYLARDWITADEEFQAALYITPHAAILRLGIACTLWAQGERSMAAEEVYRAVHEGVMIGLQGDCGYGIDLGKYFRTIPFDRGDILVLFTASPDAADIRRAEDVGLPDRDRLIAAACSGLNADLVAFGSEPLQVLQADHGVSQAETQRLLSCLDDPGKWFECAPDGEGGVDCQLAWHQEQVRRREFYLAYGA